MSLPGGVCANNKDAPDCAERFRPENADQTTAVFPFRWMIASHLDTPMCSAMNSGRDHIVQQFIYFSLPMYTSDIQYAAKDNMPH